MGPGQTTPIPGEIPQIPLRKQTGRGRMPRPGSMLSGPRRAPFAPRRVNGALSGDRASEGRYGMISALSGGIFGP